MRNRILITFAVLLSLATYECASKPQKSTGITAITYQGKPVTSISCEGTHCIMLSDGELHIMWPSEKK